MPSGTIELIDHMTVKVMSNRQICITVPWQSAFMSTEHLMNVFLKGDGVRRIENYHPRVQGFETCRMKLQTKENDSVLTEAIIDLPSNVKEDLEKQLLTRENSAQEILFAQLIVSSTQFVKSKNRLKITRS